MADELIGIYPGTFDPITKGHMDVIKKSLKIVNKLIVAVADDIPKTPIFPTSKRVELVEHDINDAGYNGKVEVLGFSGLLVDFAKKNNSSIIIRGLRAVSDFEYEFQLSAMNSKIAPDVQTILLPASENTQFIASKLVKEVARLGGDISYFVSDNVATEIKSYYEQAAA